MPLVFQLNWIYEYHIDHILGKRIPHTFPLFQSSHKLNMTFVMIGSCWKPII